MAQYRKKPVVIEAIQYNNLNKKDIDEFVGKELVVTRVIPHDSDITGKRYFLGIETLEGTMEVSPFDYVIKDVSGDFYPCQPGIFEQTYESVM